MSKATAVAANPVYVLTDEDVTLRQIRGLVSATYGLNQRYARLDDNVPAEVLGYLAEDVNTAAGALEMKLREIAEFTVASRAVQTALETLDNVRAELFARCTLV